MLLILPLVESIDPSLALFLTDVKTKPVILELQCQVLSSSGDRYAC